MLRKAKLGDSKKIYDLISYWAKKGRVLDRPLNYIYENLRDFWVYEKNGRIVAACSLHVVGWQGMAEIKSLVVSEACHKKGIGRRLVRACLDEAKPLGLKQVFALTFAPEFFRKMGFRKISKDKLPHKIWSDCLNCVFFPNKCNEEALSYRLK